MKERGLLLLALLFAALRVFPEGSKELCANGGYRAFLVSLTSASLSYPFPTLGTMKVYVKQGETIYAGSSAQGMGAGTIILRAPDGSSYSSGSSTTAGRISDRSQELAGPQPNAGGYVPYTRTVLAGQEGVWEVDFISESNGLATAGNPVPVLASAAWTQTTGQFVTAFDVTVRNSANTAFLTGRVFTNIFSGILGTFDVGFNAVFRILTKDGYQYTLDNNGQAGNGFSFFANNKGFRTSAGTASYLSVDDLNAPNIQDPRAADTGSDITHKIFFNTPAADLPATAPAPGGSTWLLTSPQTATISDLTVTGVEGTPGMAGTSPLGANIGFTANQNGTYQVSIDVNNNGSYSDPIDRKLTGNGKPGANAVYWDGLDGLGNKVRATPAGILTANISVTLFGGEVHFPFFDVERNVNGIVLTRDNGPSGGQNTLYWNDTPLTLITGTPSSPRINLTGINSTVNGHKWGTPGAGPVDFGDENGIDTWGYIVADPLAMSATFSLRETDLQVVSLTAAQACGDNQVTWTTVVRNNGPNDALRAGFRFMVPPAVTSVTVAAVSLTGTANLAAGTLTGGQYAADLALANGASMQITLTGTIAAATPQGTLSVTAALLRETDATDPDAVNPDAAAPTDATAECNAAPSGPGCNNVFTLATNFNPKPDAGPDQTISRNRLATLTGNLAGIWSQVGALPSPAEIKNADKASTLVNGFKQFGEYRFVLTSPAGCTDTVIVHVVLGTSETQVPNIITPNGDGKNDVFEILGLSAFPGSRLTIVNRWGNEVYRSNDYKNAWDGGALAEGTYFYLFERHESSGGFTPFKGWVFLRRDK